MELIPITEIQELQYEVGSSRWLTLLPHKWTYKYFARKTTRKYRNYVAFIKYEAEQKGYLDFMTKPNEF